MTQDDPTFALAFRTVIDKNITADELLEFVRKKEAEKKGKKKMKPFRSGPSSKQPYFTHSQIDQICCDELRNEGLLPNSPEPIRIDRFIEKRFKVSPTYEDLPDGVLGFTRFGKNRVKAVVISAALDAEGGKVAERRVRTTMAHEGGHGLLHAPFRARRDTTSSLRQRQSLRGSDSLQRCTGRERRKPSAMTAAGGRFRPTGRWAACYARGLSCRRR